MKFINKNKDAKVRINLEEGFKWQTVKTGETIDLEGAVGLRNDFEKVEEGAVEPEEESSEAVPEEPEEKPDETQAEIEQSEEDSNN